MWALLPLAGLSPHRFYIKKGRSLQDTVSNSIALPIELLTISGKVGFEPTTHRLPNFILKIAVGVFYISNYCLCKIFGF